MRSALYMGAVVASRRNNALREFYQRLLEADNTEKVALTVCTRDLLAPSQLGGYCIEFHDAVGVLPVTPRAALFGTLVHQTQVAICIIDGGRHFNPDKQLREYSGGSPSEVGTFVTSAFVMPWIATASAGIEPASCLLTSMRASFQITLLFPIGAFHGMVFTVPLRYAWFCHQSGPLLKSLYSF